MLHPMYNKSQKVSLHRKSQEVTHQMLLQIFPSLIAFITLITLIFPIRRVRDSMAFQRPSRFKFHRTKLTREGPLSVDRLVFLEVSIQRIIRDLELNEGKMDLTSNEM
jgi:hypothetical protein